jgi:hypothetical protein
MAFYNRRLAVIARGRAARGVWGASNDRRYFGFRSYELTWTLPLRILVAVGAYAKLELREGWRTWFSAPRATPRPAPAVPPASAPVPSPVA